MPGARTFFVCIQQQKTCPFQRDLDGAGRTVMDFSFHFFPAILVAVCVLFGLALLAVFIKWIRR